MRFPLIAALVIPTAAFAGKDPFARVTEIAREARTQIAGIQQALGEIAEGGRLDETCFRVGGLYMTLRHELEEADRDGFVDASQKSVAARLIADAKSLPSFCADAETVARDPGYEQVGSGDKPALVRELTRIDCRLRELQGQLPVRNCDKR